MKQSLFLILIAVVLLISSMAFGTQSGFFKFKADCKMEILGEPKIHEPFEAVFTFTPLEDLVNTRGILDTALLRSKSDAKYVKGDTLWVGLLENGKTYTLRAWFVVDDPILFRVQGSVRTKGATGIVVHKKGTPDPGANASNGASKLIDFRQPFKAKPRKPEDIYYLSDDSTGFIAPLILSNLDSFPNLPISPVIAHMKPNSRTTLDSSHLDINSFDTNYINITAELLKSTNPIKYNSEKINILRISPDLRERFNIEVDSTTTLIMINDTTYLINDINEKSNIKINYKENTYSLPIELLTLYNICGSASFVDNESNVQKARDILVELYNCLNSDCSSVEFTGHTYADDYGDFCFVVENSHMYDSLLV